MAFFSVFVLVLIGFVGLTIQTAYLYSSKSLLQAGLDAGAVKGAAMMLAGHSDPAAEAAAEAIASINLELNGEAPIAGGPAATPNDSYLDATTTAPGARLRITGRLQRYVFLINALPGVADITAVSGEATGTNAPLSIMIVLDHSYSMAANTIPLPPPAPVNETRFYWATRVLRENIIPLIQVGDQFGIIKFSTGLAEPGNPDRATLNVYPNTGANFSLSPIVNRNTRDITILDAQTAVQALPLPPINNFTNTYEGLVAAHTAFLNTTAVGTTRRKLTILITDGAVALMDYQIEPYLAPLSACEQAIPAPDNIKRAAKVLFNRTVSASDALRQIGSTVHTIGFTSGPTGVDLDNSSPYQNMAGDVGQWAQAIKPLILLRLANMQPWLISPPPPFDISTTPYPYDFPCTAPASTQASAPVGQYVFTFDPTQLAGALVNMLNTARVKLEQ